MAIIDLTEAGQEPFANEAEDVWLTFNGEIYNFRHLRNELESAGHVFRSSTDAEVVLHGYEEWGIDVLARLRGMFAFAIWDEKQQRLLLARDRVGKKPLFFVENSEGVKFASELQGLFELLDASPEVDRRAIAAYLELGYIPAPMTGFIGIKKVSPGCFMSFDRNGRRLSAEQPYWSLAYEPKSDASFAAAADHARQILTEAVSLRLISDRPLGAFLSGGIDSSIVVGLIAQLSGEPVKTFSVGFTESGFDELPHARRIANLWGTDHHEFVIEPDAADILPMLVRHYGEPYADSSCIPTYYVARETKAHVTVALNGDGGDESFGGYDRYRANLLASRVASAPAAGRLTRALASVLPGDADPKSRLQRARRFLDSAALQMPSRYARWMTHFTADHIEWLYEPAFSQFGGAGTLWLEDAMRGNGRLSALDAAMATDVSTYLPYDLLVKVDIATMANSLEGRSPFLDHKVMEFAARLPASYKTTLREGKRILRHAFSDLLPAENVQRRKMGFGVPVGAWFRGPLEGLLKDALLGSGSYLHQYLRPHGLQRLLSEHQERSVDHSQRLWSLLWLEMWHREVVHRSPSAA